MIDTTGLYPSEGGFPLHMPFFVEAPNPIFIPKKRHWAAQRRAAKKRRNKNKH